MPIFLRRHWFAILGLTVASTVAFFTYQPSPPIVAKNLATTPTTTLSTPPLTTSTAATSTPPPNALSSSIVTSQPSSTPQATNTSTPASISDQPQEPYSPPTTSAINDTIPITIQIASTTYALDIAPESSVYDALEVLRNTASVPIQYKYFGHDLGYFVEAIDNIRNNPRAGMYWVYSINGTKASTGISTYIIQPHDYIHWTYEASYY